MQSFSMMDSLNGLKPQSKGLKSSNPKKRSETLLLTDVVPEKCFIGSVFEPEEKIHLAKPLLNIIKGL